MTPDNQINEYEIDPELELEANMYYSGGSVWITDSTFMHISFNEVSVAELNREKAGELFPDFTGDENMWFSTANLREYDYFTAYDTDGNLMKFLAEKKYDVDWSSGN